MIFSWTKISTLKLLSSLVVLSLSQPIVKSNPIFGGQLIFDSGKNYSYIVSLQEYNQEQGTYRHICGGILIAKNWILTAAHCVYKKKVKNLAVIIGELNLKLATEKYTVSTVELFDFNWYTNRNDIGLIQLNEIVQRQPFRLQSSEIQPDRNILCKIFGYGAMKSAGSIQNRLRKAQVKLMSNDECYNILGHIMAPADGSNTVCAMGNDQDSCQGDSGGPLICTVNGTEYLYGIVSQGLRCGGTPSIYTIIDKYLNWLKAKIQN